MGVVETTTYKVETVFTVVNRASGPTDEIERSMRRAHSSAQSLGDVLKGIGAAALAGGGVMVAKRAFIDFNSTVQETKSQIAGMMALATKTSFTSNIERADKLFANLQRRAASLPGTTQEYATMMGMITQPVVNAGLGMKALEDLTVNSVVAAKALRVEAGAAARDIDQALRGQYHSVDVFTGKLLGSMGYAGETGRAKFNALSGAARAEELQKAIMQPQIGEMAAAQGASFSGMMSTMEDFFEQTGGKIGLPLFKMVTQEIKNWNDWTDKNSVKISHIVEQVGNGLVKGFQMVKDSVAFLVDHADQIIAIGKVWAATKLVGAVGGGLQTSIGNMFGAIGSAAGTSASKASVGGVLAVGTAAYMATSELMQLTGASDALLRMIDPQKAAYDKLQKSMQEWDDALAQSRANLQKTETGAKASDFYGNMRGAVEMYDKEIRLLRTVDQMAATRSPMSMIDKLRENNDYSERELSKYAMDPKARASRITYLEKHRGEVVANANIAAVATDARMKEAMEEMTVQQRAGIDVQKATQAVMMRMIESITILGEGPLNKDIVKSILLGDAVKDANPFAQAKPSTTTINIARVEVPAKDPDRWIMDLDAAAKSHLAAPRAPRGQLRGR